MKNPSNKYPIVSIRWLDAYANSEWMTPEEAEEVCGPDFMTVHEVGWLLKETGEYLLLASRFNPSTGKFGAFQLIPPSWCDITTEADPNDD